MNVLDLFSGIGGFSLGLERAGMRTIAFCEVDAFCRKVLRKHWPNVPIFEDIRRLHAKEIPGAVDLICGGYPCQPFSTLGKRSGTKDDRYLWPEVMRLIQEFIASGNKPAWCLFENVGGHVSMGLDATLSNLESQNYTAWPFIIPACAVNAPHRRDRVWIVAYDSDRCFWPPVNFFSGRDSEPESSGICWDDIRRYTEREWCTLSPICGSSNGVSAEVDRSKRLKALGNAVVPQIPEVIGRVIMAIEKNMQKQNL